MASRLGKDEIAATRAALGWNHEPFVIPPEVYDGWNAKGGWRGAREKVE